MLNYLKGIMPDQEFKHYRVATNIFPKDIEECEGYIITGSPASCYEDLDWIKNLIEFIKNYMHKKENAWYLLWSSNHCSCFSGEVKKSEKGWGLGIREFDIVKIISG